MAQPWDTLKDLGGRFLNAFSESSYTAGQPVLNVSGPGGGALPVSMSGSSISLTPASGQKVVAAGPTATALAAVSTQADQLYVIANISNQSNIYLGAAAVSAATGLTLEPGRGISMESVNLNAVYIFGTAGEGVTFFYLS